MSTAPTINMVEEKLSQGPSSTKELPSIRNTLLKPKALISILAFSLVMNFILLIAAISASTGPDPRVVTKPSPTNTTTSSPTLKPTQTNEETLNSLQKCFRDCQVEELLSQTRTEALKVSDSKVIINYNSEKDRNCYGGYIENSTPDKQFNSYFTQVCGSGFVSKPPSDSIQIGDNLYTLNSSENWNLDSKPRIGQPKLIQLLDEVVAQQEKSITDSASSTKYKQITSSSKTINDLSQLVTKKISITLNDYLEVSSYTIEIEKISTEIGYFIGLGEKNNIQAPI